MLCTEYRGHLIECFNDVSQLICTQLFKPCNQKSLGCFRRLPNKRTALTGQFHLHDAAVFGRTNACGQSLFFEAIQDADHGSGMQIHAPGDIRDRDGRFLGYGSNSPELRARNAGLFLNPFRLFVYYLEYAAEIIDNLRNHAGSPAHGCTSSKRS